MHIEFDGLDAAMKKLEGLAKKAKELGGEHQVRVSEMFTPAFMRTYTDFESFDAMIEASGFQVQSQADFENISDDEWETLVRTKTRFARWDEMLRAAGGEWVKRNMGY